MYIFFIFWLQNKTADRLNFLVVCVKEPWITSLLRKSRDKKNNFFKKIVEKHQHGTKLILAEQIVIPIELWNYRIWTHIMCMVYVFRFLNFIVNNERSGCVFTKCWLHDTLCVKMKERCIFENAIWSRALLGDFNPDTSRRIYKLGVMWTGEQELKEEEHTNQKKSQRDYIFHKTAIVEVRRNLYKWHRLIIFCYLRVYLETLVYFFVFISLQLDFFV
jgi:hypothetical protein